VHANFITFENKESIQKKVDYAIKNNLGSIILFELYSDSCESDIVNLIRDAIGENGPKVIAYYGGWHIYDQYYAYIPPGNNRTCSDAYTAEN